MISIDEDALECDLAETYHIYDYRELPPQKVALFAVGLREESRIKMAMSGAKVSIDTYLLATIADYLGWCVWSKTKDAEKGKNKPQSIVDILNGKEEPDEEVVKFENVDDFENLWKSMTDSIKEEKGG